MPQNAVLLYRGTLEYIISYRILNTIHKILTNKDNIYARMKWEILPFCLAIGGISVTVRKNETKLVVIPILKRSFAQTAGS